MHRARATAHKSPAAFFFGHGFPPDPLSKISPSAGMERNSQPLSATLQAAFRHPPPPEGLERDWIEIKFLSIFEPGHAQSARPKCPRPLGPPNRSKIGSKINQKNNSKNDRILIRKITKKVTPKWTPKSTNNRSWGQLGPQEGPKRIQEGSRDRIWTIFD